MAVVNKKQTDGNPLRSENIRLLAEVAQLQREQQDAHKRIAELTQTNDNWKRTVDSLAKANEVSHIIEEAQQAAIAREREQAAGLRATDLAKVNAALQAEIIERNRVEQVSRGQTEAVVRALNILAVETDLSAFLSHILCAIATQLNTQMCALYFYDRKTDLISLHMTYHYGQTLQGDEQAGNPSAGNPHRAEKDGFWAALVQTRRPVIIPDVSKDAYFHQFTWLSLNGIQSLFSVPLVLGADVIGYLVVRSKNSRAYAPEEIKLAQALAHQITLAVNTTRLAEAAKQAAVTHEKEKATQERAVELARINLALTHEIQERQRAEQVARGQTEALTRSLHALAQEPELDRFLGNVLRVLIEQMGEESGSIWLYDPDYEVNLLHTEFYEGRLHRAPRIEPHEVKRQWDNEFLPILRSGQILLHTESDFVTRPAYTVYQSYFAERGIKTILNIPLFFGQGFFGIFAVRSQKIRSFSPLELELAQALAHQAMLAIQITRLADEARQSSIAREEGAALLERNRIAGEIHDGLAQGFTGITVQLGVAERKIARGDVKEACQHLKEALELAKEGLIEARRSVLALRPAALQQYTLPSALARLTERNDNPETCRVQIITLGELRPLSPLVEDNLLRITQEALSNALQHASAPQVNLELIYAEEVVHLRVKDNGKGFNLETPLPGGFGLQSMRERAARIGGRLTVTSSPGNGTEILVEVNTQAQDERETLR